MANSHELRLENRSNLRITGVDEVESFDEETVVLHTPCGVLVLRGENLHALSIDGGNVIVDGTVQSLCYEEPRRSGGFLARLLR